MRMHPLGSPRHPPSLRRPPSLRHPPSLRRPPSLRHPPSLLGLLMTLAALAACASGGASRHWLECDHGDAHACIVMANLHTTGDGAARDPVKAAYYDARACDLDHADGCSNAGLAAFHRGDRVEASQLFERACLQHHAASCLGLFLTRTDPPQDKARERACKLGHKPACRLAAYRVPTTDRERTVADLVASRLATQQACAAPEAARDPKFGGVVTVELSLDEAGAWSDVRVSSDISEAFTACITPALSGLQGPAGAPGPVVVRGWFGAEPLLPPRGP